MNNECYLQSQESTAQQQLTSVADQTAMQTPTLTFKETGETIESSMPGNHVSAHGVGEFKSTEILERMVLLEDGLWLTSDLLNYNSPKYNVDVVAALFANARNSVILSQFNYARFDIEVTIRLNTNQFFYGSLVATLYNGSGDIGDRIDRRMVLDPTIISASLETSVVKSWTYNWPEPWQVTSGPRGVLLSLDVLCPLTAANTGMPDHIGYSVWARFVNVKLAWPTGPPLLSKPQSGRKFPKDAPRVTGKKVELSKIPPVTVKQKRPMPPGTLDPRSVSKKVTSVERAIDAVSSITIADAANSVVSLGKFAMDNWTSIAAAAAFFLDKPDRSVVQAPMIMEPWIDAYSADMPDSNVVMAPYCDRYLTPSMARVPMSKNFTFNDYAAIPGLRARPWSFVNAGDTASIFPIDQLANDVTTLSIPLDYAILNSSMNRGSVKLCLMFFASTFFSARFSVEYSVALADYTNGITRVVDVKGDTMDCFTIPYISNNWWRALGDTSGYPHITVTMQTPIASTDTSGTPLIYLAAWVSGAPDMQFALPRLLTGTQWTYPPATKLPRRSRPQCSVSGMFESEFEPIVEDCFFDLDNGYCNTDQLSSISDICKTYSPYYSASCYFLGSVLDLDDPGGGASYAAFRGTFFGAWRACFFFRSGGFKWRFYDYGDGPQSYYLTSETSSLVNGYVYTSKQDEPARITVPQLCRNPYAFLTEAGFIQQQSYVFGTASLDSTAQSPALVGARDDLQFGYPVLPRRIQLNS